MVAYQSREIVVGKDTFAGEEGKPSLDLLGRREQGERLSELVDRVTIPFVIALDGDWGTGKSHFLKLWCGSHATLFRKPGKVIYFDAFANDWQDDPLLGLTKAIAAEVSYDDPTVTQMGKSVLRMGGRVVAAAAKGYAKGLLGAGAVDEAMKSVIDVLGGASDATISEMWKEEQEREGELQNFRTHLGLLAEQFGKLILVIDELDRCRPDYALAALEIAKHVFSETGVVVVLGVNLRALSHSVRKRYGAEMDAEAYLEKFINLSVQLPRTHNGQKRDWTALYDHEADNLGLAKSKRVRAGREVLLAVSNQAEVTPRAARRIVHAIALSDSNLERFVNGRIVVALTVIVMQTLRPSALAPLFANQHDRLDFLRRFADRTVLGLSLHGVWIRFVGASVDDPEFEKMFGSCADQGAWQEILSQCLSMSFFEPPRIGH